MKLEPLLSRYHNDPELADLLLAFHAALHEACDRLQNNLRAESLSRIRHVAHQLKGAGGGYGYPEITEAAFALEAACDRSDRISEEICTLVGALVEICQRAQAGIQQVQGSAREIAT